MDASDGRGWIRRVRAAIVIGGLGALLVPAAASAVTIPVASTSDTSPGACTLRSAITAANTDSASGGCYAGSGTDRIAISATGTINLQGALPEITTPMAIDGPGAGSLTVNRDTGGAYGIFRISSPGPVTISGITITDGSRMITGSGLNDGGGGIYNESDLTLIGVAVVNNAVTTTASSGSAGEASGGGVFSTSSGSLSIIDSSISGNSVDAVASGGATARPRGAGIFTDGPLEILRSSISDNNSTGNSDGTVEGNGGIYASDSVAITSSTIAGNSATLTSTGAEVNPFGGGLWSVGAHPVTLDRVTVHGNELIGTGGDPGPTDVERGGGIAINDSSQLTVKGSTFSENDGEEGANVNLDSSPNNFEFENTIVADPNGGGSNCFVNVASIDSLGHNLVFPADAACSFTEPTDISGSDPTLGPLADNGGPIHTQALPVSSPAVDAGAAAGAIRDGRGDPRPVDVLSVPDPIVGDGSDIGAFELQGGAPNLSSADFGPHLTGTTGASKAIVVENETGSPITYGTASLTGAGSAAFEIGADTCSGQTIAAAGTCSLDVSFHADTGTIGDKAAQLGLTNDLATPGLDVPLAGSEVAPDTQPAVGSLNFGMRRTGENSAVRLFTVTNDALVPVPIAGVAPEGASAAAFAVGPDGCSGATLQSGERCEVGVGFLANTGTNGTKTASLVIDDGGATPPSVALSGIEALELLTADPASIGFGDVVFGTGSPTRAITLTNSAPAALTAGPVALAGTDEALFAVEADTCSSKTLASGATCSVTVAFDPPNTISPQWSAELSVGTDISPTPLSVPVSAATVPDTVKPTARIESIEVGKTKGKGKRARAKAKARFKGTDNVPGQLTFRCKVDKKDYKACSSPYKIKKLKPGKHVLKVKATDAAGNESTPAKKKFRVRKKR